MILGRGAPCALDVAFVDIDPAQARIAGIFLQAVPSTSGTFSAAHARAFLRSDPGGWPAIVVDTYSNPRTLPQHLLTVEFYRLARSRLADGGSLYVNHLAWPDDESVPDAGGADAAVRFRRLLDMARRNRGGARLARRRRGAWQCALPVPEEHTRRRPGDLFRRGSASRPGPLAEMTNEWQSLTHRFAISGHKGYVTVASDEHGRPVLLEIRMAKVGWMRCRAEGWRRVPMIGRERSSRR